MDRVFIAVGEYSHEYLGCHNINTSGVCVNHQMVLAAISFRSCVFWL